MARLTAEKRRELPAKDFALSKGHYPDDTERRARSALSRISANGSPEEKAKVRRAVHRKYPSMKVEGVMHDGGEVSKTGAWKLEKGEVVVPKHEAKKMSMSARAEAHLGGKKKSEGKKKKVHHMHVRRSHNGGYIAENHHTPDEETGETPQMEEHTLPDMSSLQDHMAQSMPEEAPPEGAIPPTGGGAPPAGGMPPAAAGGMPPQGA